MGNELECWTFAEIFKFRETAALKFPFYACIGIDELGHHKDIDVYSASCIEKSGKGFGIGRAPPVSGFMGAENGKPDVGVEKQVVILLERILHKRTAITRRHHRLHVPP